MVFAVRTHHYAKHKMWPVATDEAWSVCLCVCMCVCLSVCVCVCLLVQPWALWKQPSQTSQGAVWGVDSSRQRNHVLGEGPDTRSGRGSFFGERASPGTLYV